MAFTFSPRRLAAAFLALPALVRADVVLAPLFTDHAVLQRDKAVPVWGTADAGEHVSVVFQGQTAGTTAGSDGRWVALLPEFAANAQGADLVVTGKNVVTLHDVVVGEVWLCAGQSNMEFMVKQGLDAPAEIAAANNPLIRHVRISHAVAEAPASTGKTSGWLAATPENVGGFTAVGYFFARDIQRKLGVPVGLIHSSWGGTPIESWMSPLALDSNPAFAVSRTRWAQTVVDYPALKAAYTADLAKWTTADAAEKKKKADVYAAWQKKNPKPRPPRGPGDSWTPTGLYNGMINPLMPYALRGVLWYQGESNTDHASEYHALFSAMITAWRAHLGQGDVPFFWVQIANFNPTYETIPNLWPWLREAQTQTLALPNTGQALAIDIGETNDIHPKNKQEVGRRLALLAKHRVYGFTNDDDTGPTFAGATREGRAMRVRFTHASDGLIARDKPVQSLELAGADKKFHPATARIDRDTLVVSSPEVAEPVAVRYAWVNDPGANLCNGAGLPAVPFRSDAW